MVKVGGQGQRRGSRFGVKVRGQGQGSRSWGQCQGHDRWSQGRRSRSMVRSGYRSWGQVGGGSRLGVQVGGSRSREGSRFWGHGRGQGCGQGRGQGQCLRSWGQGQGHDWWSQGLGSRSGSMLGVKGVVKVMGRWSIPGGLGSDGRRGEVGDKQSVPFKNS